MTEPIRITCQGTCSRPIAYEVGSETYISYLYQLDDAIEIRYRTKSEAFVLEHKHLVNLAWEFANPSDDFSGTFDSDKWNALANGYSLGIQSGGFYTQVVGLDRRYSDLFFSGVDSSKWGKTGTTSFVDVNNGELQFVHPSGVVSDTSGISTLNRSYFFDDFDIHVKIDGSNIGTATTGSQYLRLELKNYNEDNRVYVGFYALADGTKKWQTDYYKNSVWQSEVTAAASPSTGYVRLVRSGDTLTAYYGYDREAWTSLQAITMPPASGTLFTEINALMRAEAYNGYSGSADDYTVVQNLTSQYHRLESTWKILGGFDIVIPYQITFWEEKDATTFTASIVDDLRKNFRFDIGRKKTASTETIFGSFVDEIETLLPSEVGIADPTGNFRLTREGDTLTSYYWNGTSWTQLQQVVGYTTPIKLQLTTENSINYPLAEVAIGGVVVASGDARWIDPNTYDIDVRDDGSLELVFVSSNRMFSAVQDVNNTGFTSPQGLIIYQDEGAKVAQAYDAALTHSSSHALLSYIDENKAVRYVRRDPAGGDWEYPEFQFSTITASGDPLSIDADWLEGENLFTIAWDSTEFDGEYDILYTKFGLLAGQAASGVLAIAKVGMWNPKVECGYFYIEDREYYLYSDKQAQRVDASSGSFILSDFSKDRRFLQAPVVITSASGYAIGDATSTPFARTWAAPYGTGDTYADPTPTKYRRRWNLSDRKETAYSIDETVDYSFLLGTDYPREYYIEWGEKASDGFYDPVFHIANTDSVLGDVIVEYEAWNASGYYTVDHLDLNPLHTANTVNKFAIIRENEPTPHEVFLDSINPYILGPSGVTKIISTVVDQYGTPVQGEIVTYTMEPYKETQPTLFGNLSSSTMTTSFDGSCAVEYSAPADLISIMGSLAAGIHIRGSIKNGTSSDAIKLELGNPYSST